MTSEDRNTPEARRLRAKVAAHTSWAKTPDRARRTAPARAAALARFEDQVDPDGVMSTQDRAAAAESAMRAHFIAMAARSADARREKRRRRASGIAGTAA